MTNFNTKLSILTGTGRFYEEIWYRADGSNKNRDFRK